MNSTANFRADAYHSVSIDDYVYAEDGCQFSVSWLQIHLGERKFVCIMD